MPKPDQPTSDNINLRSEEVQEILTRPPRRIVRVGITLILLVVLALFVGSYYLKYPDIVPATITVSTENLPAEVMAKVSGRIDSMLVTEKQHVAAGDILAVLENQADLGDVLWVKSILGEPDSTINSLQTNSLQLGELQQPYAAYNKAKDDYDFFLSADYHNRKIAVINKQITAQKGILQKSCAQLSVSQKQLASAQRLFEMDSTLFAKGMLSLAEYETAKNGYLQQMQSYESVRLSIDNLRMGHPHPQTETPFHY